MERTVRSLSELKHNIDIQTVIFIKKKEEEITHQDQKKGRRVQEHYTPPHQAKKIQEGSPPNRIFINPLLS